MLKKFLIIFACSLLAFALISCKRVKKAPSPPDIIQGSSQAWYGRVNKWVFDYDMLEAEVVECATHNVTGYIIEMWGWGRYSEVPYEQRLEITRDAYEYLLSLCRKHGLYLFVSICNDNAGLGKYGEEGIPISEQMNELYACVEIIKRNGSGNVVVQPVSETRTDAGREFEIYASNEISDFTLVYNGDGRPDHQPEWADFIAWHPFDIDEKLPLNALIISDTGRIIRQMGEGLEGPGKPLTVNHWAVQLSAQGVPVIGYYAFKYDKFDSETIRILGKAIKQASK